MEVYGHRTGVDVVGIGNATGSCMIRIVCGFFRTDLLLLIRTRMEMICRPAADRLVEAAHSCGPVTIYAQKTRIVFMVRVRFAGVMTRKRWLYFSLWLTRKIEHSRLHKVDVYGPRSYGHQFRLSDPAEIDERLEALICEAYRVGRQEHLDAR